MLDHRDCLIRGKIVPQELLGELNETPISLDAGEEMRQRMHNDGYVFLRGVIDQSSIEHAREEVFQRLFDVGEIKEPARDGIATGISRRKELVGDLGQFWQSVSEGPALRRVSHGEQIQRVMDVYFGEPSRPQDYIFLRPSVVGRATDLHYDYPFFARGSQRVCTVWTAIGEISPTDGTLAVVEGSHRFDDLIAPVKQIDYESTYSPRVALAGDAIEFVNSRSTRLLTAHFHPGDVIIFGMTTLHGSLDNHSPIGRTRLSCDVRWQPTADPFDARYMGPNPPGTTGAGYGELNGAKPLDEPWHIR